MHSIHCNPDRRSDLSRPRRKEGSRTRKMKEGDWVVARRAAVDFISGQQHQPQAARMMFVLLTRK